MKRKIIFLLLLQSSIIFICIADLYKLILRQEDWLSVAIIGFIFSCSGGIFYEYLPQTKKDKIIPFDKSKKSSKTSKKEMNEWFLLMIVLMVGLVMAFFRGVILEMEWGKQTVIAMVCFLMGAWISNIRDNIITK